MNQAQMVSQQGLVPQSGQNSMVAQTNVGQQPVMQTLPNQSSYPQHQQTAPQGLNSQASMVKTLFTHIACRLFCIR